MIESLLKKFSSSNMDIYYAKNLDFISNEFDILNFKDKRISLYLDNLDYYDIVKDNADKNSLDGIGVLFAHGAMLRKDWVFDDSNKLYKVQDWVNIHDGKYSLLMLCCYAGENVNIKANKSAILLPDNSYSRRTIPEIIQSRLYLPDRGIMKDDDMSLYLEEIRKTA